jgi:hypothetical protein
MSFFHLLDRPFDMWFYVGCVCLLLQLDDLRNRFNATLRRKGRAQAGWFYSGIDQLYFHRNEFQEMVAYHRPSLKVDIHTHIHACILEGILFGVDWWLVNTHVVVHTAIALTLMFAFCWGRVALSFSCCALVYFSRLVRVITCLGLI